MNLEIKHLSRYITSKTSGIIWLTDEYLDYKTPGLYEFNYLLNGMLIKSISNHKEQGKKTEKSHFFLGDNFSTPLFIGHSVIENKDDFKIMHNHLQMASSFVNNDSTIYIFNKSKNTANFNILKELGAKYLDYQFKNLNI